MPRATVRLQFHKDFTLDDAAGLVDYYAALGISHIYASPLTTARPGSQHGYDVVDPSRINSELGGEPALRRLSARLREAQMGLILDIVPNHMAIAGAHNPWWQDVLKWGKESRYAHWFDIEWKPDDPALQGKVLAPFLGQPYGDVLSAGEITLCFDASQGEIYFGYHAHRFPLSPTDYADVLCTAGALILEPVIAAFEMISLKESIGTANEYADAACALLKEFARCEQGMDAINAALRPFSPSHRSGREKLHALLECQHYRLAWWRVAAEEINYRRFFEITDLAGVRVEREDVFGAVHELVFRLYAEGLIDGVRIDHIDGLADPRAYCLTLRERLEKLTCDRPVGLQYPPYIIAEKILSKGEYLRNDWMLDGTTGYDFMDQVGALLHDPAGQELLDRLWRAVASGAEDFGAEVCLARRQLLAENFAGELDAGMRIFHRLARANLHTRDFSLAALRRVVIELLIFFPVYRTYVVDAQADPIDQRILMQTAQDVRQHLRAADYQLLDAIIAWLGGDMSSEPLDADISALRKRSVIRFQQLTPPLTAKSVEDTVFYRYGRLLSRNEVGSSPEWFSSEPVDFHIACSARAQQFPNSMLATATHDHKRGEDSRARLAVLSEMHEEWEHAVACWMALNTPHKKEIFSEDGMRVLEAPAPSDEYMLYQVLISTWPIELSIDNQKGMRELAERIDQWQTKAMRETKQVSAWAQPNEEYENACQNFLFDILDAAKNRTFLIEMEAFIQRILAPGVVNSLSQLLLRLSSPGVPDLYQGTEYWDFSLVDPDNRRPVDHSAHRKHFQEILPINEALQHWKDGRIKQKIIGCTLLFRKKFPDLFSKSVYIPLAAEGPQHCHLVAFLRSHEDQHIIVIVTRFASRLLHNIGVPAIASHTWKDTFVRLPETIKGSWTDIFTGKKAEIKDGLLALFDTMDGLTVALLQQESSHDIGSE